LALAQRDERNLGSYKKAGQKDQTQNNKYRGEKRGARVAFHDVRSLAKALPKGAWVT